MGCGTSSTAKAPMNSVAPLSAAKGGTAKPVGLDNRFCECQGDDGSASFICAQCNKIKKRSKAVVKKALKKSRQKQRMAALDTQNIDSETSSTGERNEPMSPGRRKNMLSEVIDLRMFQEMAFRKIFRDFDADKNQTLTAPELREMVIAYQQGKGIYRPPTMQEAEAFIRVADRLGDHCIAEKEFVTSMMYVVENGENISADGMHEDADLYRAQKKLEQFGALVIARLEMRALTLYSIFQKYSNTHFIRQRNKWMSNIIDTSDLFRMMNDFATEPKHRPKQDDVLQFMSSMDSNGDMILQAREFLSYMLRGMVQSKESMKQFSRRSRMHKKISYFLNSLEMQMEANEKTLSLDRGTIKRVLSEINHVLSDHTKTYTIAAIDDSGDADTSEPAHATALTIDDISKIASDVNDHNEMLDLHQSKKDFEARVKRKETEKKLVHNKQAERTRQKLFEREKKRVISLYNPSILRKAACEMDDVSVRDRILEIVGETSPKSSSTNHIGADTGTKGGKKRKSFKREASRRLSVSKRNIERMHIQYDSDQAKLNYQRELIHSRQASHAKEKLRKKRSYNRKQRAKEKLPHPPLSETGADTVAGQRVDESASAPVSGRVLNPGLQAMSLSFGGMRRIDSDSSFGTSVAGSEVIGEFDLSHRPDSASSTMSIPH